MSERKAQSKKAQSKTSTLGKEVLAALTEFAEALKKGEVAAHLRQRPVKIRAAAANHKPSTLKKLRTPPMENGKKKTRD